MKRLNQDIKERSFCPVYCLYGEEAFLKRNYKNLLKEAILGDDTMNFQSFYGKETNLTEIISLADTMPFFAERRLILVEDSGFFKSASDALVQYLPSMPDTTILLFVETEVDKRNRLYKKVKDMGYAAELKRQGSAQLARWAGGILTREQKKITKHTMELFLSMAGDDMENITSELDKVISYTLGRDVITEEDIDAYIKLYNVKISKLYEMGYCRNGCMYCGFGVHMESGKNRFQRLSETHPIQYSYLVKNFGDLILEFDVQIT